MDSLKNSPPGQECTRGERASGRLTVRSKKTGGRGTRKSSRKRTEKSCTVGMPVVMAEVPVMGRVPVVSLIPEVTRMPIVGPNVPLIPRANSSLYAQSAATESDGKPSHEYCLRTTMLRTSYNYLNIRVENRPPSDSKLSSSFRKFSRTPLLHNAFAKKRHANSRARVAKQTCPMLTI